MLYACFVIIIIIIRILRTNRVIGVFWRPQNAPFRTWQNLTALLKVHLKANKSHKVTSKYAKTPFPT